MNPKRPISAISINVISMLTPSATVFVHRHYPGRPSRPRMYDVNNLRTLERALEMQRTVMAGLWPEIKETIANERAEQLKDLSIEGYASNGQGRGLDEGSPGEESVRAIANNGRRANGRAKGEKLPAHP